MLCHYVLYICCRSYTCFLVRFGSIRIASLARYLCHCGINPELMCYVCYVFLILMLLSGHSFLGSTIVLGGGGVV